MLFKISTGGVKIWPNPEHRHTVIMWSFNKDVIITIKWMVIYDVKNSSFMI